MNQAKQNNLRLKLNLYFEGVELPDRIARVQNSISLSGSILEISPNWAPLVLSEDLEPGGTITYCDRMPTNWLENREKDNPLRAKFDLPVMTSNFDWTPGLKLGDCTELRFDYVISSHVVEHVPDLLGHMIEVSNVLKPQGKYTFVIPNGRGTGEYFKRLSEESDVIEHYFLGSARTSPGQNWDFLVNAVKYDGTAMKDKKKDDFVRHHTDAEAIQDAARCFQEYVDVHSWVFNRSSLLSMITRFNQLNLFPFTVIEFQESNMKTPDGEPYEFIVTLSKCDYLIPNSWVEIVSRNTENEPEASLKEKFQLERKLNSLERAIFEKDRAIFELQNSSFEMKKLLDDVLGSKSWIITRPIRELRRLLHF